MDQGRPISYEALAVGTPVLSATDTTFGKVEHVLQVPELDLFDGIAVKTKQGLRFVDRDQITDITTTLVRCALSDGEADALPEPKGSLVLHPDTAMMRARRSPRGSVACSGANIGRNSNEARLEFLHETDAVTYGHEDDFHTWIAGDGIVECADRRRHSRRLLHIDDATALKHVVQKHEAARS